MAESCCHDNWNVSIGKGQSSFWGGAHTLICLWCSARFSPTLPSGHNGGLQSSLESAGVTPVLTESTLVSVSAIEPNNSDLNSPGVASCPHCDKTTTTISSLWQHINSVHISRGIFLPSFFQRFDRLICSQPSCRFAYLSRWSVCQRSLGDSRRCGAPLIDPSAVLGSALLFQLMCSVVNWYLKTSY